MVRCRIIFSGEGGQGLITAAIILAEAAALHEGLEAVQSQSYSPAVRGGATRSDVIISDREIRFPRVIQPNVLVCLTQKAYNKYRDLIRPGGLLLTDKHYVKQEKKVDARQVELDMYVETKGRIGKPVVFNVCMLGSLIELTQLVKKTSILKVLKNRMPSELLSENNEAIKLGIELAVKYKQTNRFNFYFY